MYLIGGSFPTLVCHYFFGCSFVDFSETVVFVKVLLGVVLEVEVRVLVLDGWVVSVAKQVKNIGVLFHDVIDLLLGIEFCVDIEFASC